MSVNGGPFGESTATKDLPQRPQGAVDPSIMARQAAAQPTPGMFDPEKKVYAMLKSDPVGTLKKIGAATVAAIR